jgi:hypothetical protein
MLMKRNGPGDGVRRSFVALICRAAILGSQPVTSSEFAHSPSNPGIDVGGEMDSQGPRGHKTCGRLYPRWRTIDDKTQTSVRTSLRDGPQGQRSSEASGAKLAVSRSRSTRGTAAAEGTSSLDDSASARTGSGARRRFRIQFQGEVVVEAADIRDALRQAESFRPTVITAVARED